jgi:hypothetical protein
MRKSTITMLGVCLLLVAIAVPAVAQTDSSVHKLYKGAEGVATGLDEGVWTIVAVKRASDNQSFRAPDASGDLYGSVKANVSVSYSDTNNNVKCHDEVSVSDADFTWSPGHATLNVDTACGPMTAVWRGDGDPTIEPYNRYHTDYLGNVTHGVGTDWERPAIMTATINGHAADHFSWDAMLTKHTSMYTVDNAE